MKHPFTLWLLALLLIGTGARANQVYLSDLDLTHVSTGWGAVQANKSIGGNALTLCGQAYDRGIGLHAPGHVIVKLNGSASRFKALIGLDDEVRGGDGYGNFDYFIIRNERDTVMRGTCDLSDAQPAEIDLDLTGWQYLSITVENGRDENWSDHADLVNPWVEYTGETPAIVDKVERVPEPQDGFVYLGDLAINNIRNGWGTSQWNKSIGGNTLTMKGIRYEHGVGVHGPVDVIVSLEGSDATRFTALLGIDDEANGQGDQGNCLYTILKNGKQPVQNGQLRRTDTQPVALDIDITGWRYLVVRIENGVGGNGNDHVDLADARLYYDTTKDLPQLLAEASFNLRPACATTFYSLPGVRLMNKLRVNDESAQISVSGLPAGLSFNAARNLVEGVISTPGTYHYTLTATSALDQMEQDITLIVSPDLVSPAPAMTWISWNVYDYNVNEEKILRTADLMKSLGLADLGWQYIVIDDAWQAGNDHSLHREADGTPKADATKFPHGMKYVADRLHSLGLKAGIYSDAAASTCGGFIGSYGHEDTDAQAYARWGFDFLKYDYCGAPQDSASAHRRYAAMRRALDATGRPFFLNICEWGHFQPWIWGAQAGGNQWRISDDIRDTWRHPDTSGSLLGFIQVLDRCKGLAYYAGPNHYNDMDMMCVGLYGKGSPSSVHGLPDALKGMTTTEYQTQFSMWAMLAAPLTLSFELANINDDTRRILSNTEVIALNQDLMGQQALCLNPDENVETYVKDLENGDMAVALLNRGTAPATASFSAEDLFLDPAGRYAVRDLWLHQNVDTLSTGRFAVSVAPHETKVYRLSAVPHTDGIHATGQQGDTIIRQEGGRLVIDFPENYTSKWVALFDLGGRLVTSARTTAARYVFPTSQLPTPPYLVRTVCNGVAASKKMGK